MDPVIIQSPVKGIWSFMNPPGHHQNAKDFVAVNHRGLPYELTKVLRHLFYKLPVTETYAWNQEVFSPFDGVVIKAENSAKDRMELNLFRDLINGLIISPRNNKHNIGYFLGNYVMLKSVDGILALCAHLQQGSIVVTEGMNVISGERIAKVGNSGNTIQPHLHFQVMREIDVTSARPIPFIFESCKIDINGVWKSGGSKLPADYQKFHV